MARKLSKTNLGWMLAAGVVPLVAYSQVYSTEEESLKSVFPGESFARKQFTLTADEIQKIETSSGEKVRSPAVTVWVSAKKNVVFIDQVLGKHEFITYAAGVSAKKEIQGIEILEYRETYGYQVHEAKWRAQFVGKNSASTLKLNKDITNISGATLSSAHITGGVRRILQTYEAIQNRL